MRLAPRGLERVKHCVSTGGSSRGESRRTALPRMDPIRTETHRSDFGNCNCPTDAVFARCAVVVPKAVSRNRFRIGVIRGKVIRRPHSDRSAHHGSIWRRGGGRTPAIGRRSQIKTSAEEPRVVSAIPQSCERWRVRAVAERKPSSTPPARHRKATDGTPAIHVPAERRRHPDSDLADRRATAVETTPYNDRASAIAICAEQEARRPQALPTSPGPRASSIWTGPYPSPGAALELRRMSAMTARESRSCERRGHHRPVSLWARGR